MALIKWAVVFVLLTIQSADAALNLGVFSTSTKVITFQWEKVSSASSYKLTLTNGVHTVFATYGANTVIGSVNGLSADTTYTCTITAINGSGIMISDTITHSTAPDRVDDSISVTPTDSTSVSVVFVPVAGVSTYIIRAQNPADFTIISHTTVMSSPAQVSGLQPFTEYQFSVMSANSGGYSQPTSSVTAKTLLAPPQIQSSSASESTIELTWAPVANADQYTMSLYKFNDQSSKMTLNSTGTSLTFSGLDAGRLYVVEGFAWDSDNRQGESSAPANQTTRPPAPTSVGVTIATTNNQLYVRVSWSMDPNVYGEILYTATSDQGLNCSSPTLTCDLGPVSCGTVHSVTVTSQNIAGPSVPSSPASITTVPCPPQNLAVTETSPGSCNFTWDPVAHADGYQAYIKNVDGVEATCNTTTATSCAFSCDCGYTYLMSVFAHNSAGLSPAGPTVNYTTIPCCPTMMNVSLVSTDTLEIEWVAGRGAELYETRANDSSGVILCNDTAPVCVLSYLSCDTPYSVKVIPCNDLSGCNHNCPVLTRDTAPCMPTSLALAKVDSSTVTVSWMSTNRAATFLVTAKGAHGVHNCSTGMNSCDISDLDCGCTYEVGVTATSSAGESLPSFTEMYETAPCCPSTLSVMQVTQAMTNVSWSTARGAHTFLTSLTSSKGYARCHTEDTHCLMGCITCGTNYTVTMAAYSLSGLRTNCSYQGFSSSLCCPFGVRITRISNMDLRVSWRSSPGPSHVTEVEMRGASNYSCRASPGDTHCDLTMVQCGVDYTLEVAPVKADGTRETFCPHRKYGVVCAGNNVGSVLFRGKRSVE